MSGCMVIISLALLFCKVHSQLCGPPILPPPCPAPYLPVPCEPLIPPCSVPCPQVTNPNPYVTTIVDNSVSNALVNALQLLIVSNLIGSTISPSTPMINNLGPLLDTLVYPNPCPVEVVVPEYVTGPNYEIVQPCGPITTCGPYYDITPPYIPYPYYDLILPCGPVSACGPNYEILPPCGPVIDVFPPPYCGLTEVISPNYFGYTETLSPFYNCMDSLPYNGYSETLCPVYGIETIGPNFCGGLPEFIPNYINYPTNEMCPSLYPYYGGFAETITPTVAALPNMFGCLNEVAPPCMPLPNIYAPEVSPFGSLVTPNYYGGLTDIPVPLAAEVVFPSAIPAQLTCNFGYSPSSLPCVRVNVEPLAYENCLCNGYGGPIYY